VVLWLKARERPPQAAVPPPAAPVLPAAPAASVPSAGPADLDEIIARSLPAVVRVETGGGSGSGFFVAADLVITNAHVLGAASYASIRTQDGRKFEAFAESRNSEYDLALLRVRDAPPALRPLALGSATRLRVGQDLLAIGSPLGVLQNTVTRGILSGFRRVGPALVLQTDAALNPGNSGGPMLNREGTVVGIGTAISKGNPGLNFAIAADHAIALLEGRPLALPEGTFRAQEDPLPDLKPAQPSETDRQRGAGARAYEARLARVSVAAARLEASFTSFLAGAYQGTHAGAPGRTFQLLTDSGAFPGAWNSGSEARLEEYRKLARSLRTEFQAAEDEARRADVYPGTRREVRARCGLEDGWWER
jgi:hypothetical protein